MSPMTMRLSAVRAQLRSWLARGGGRAVLAPGAATGLVALSIWLLWDVSARSDAEQAGVAAVAMAAVSTSICSGVTVK